jgi:hypothetical protein
MTCMASRGLDAWRLLSSSNWISCAAVAVRGLSSDLVGMNWVGLGCQTFSAGRACGPIQLCSLVSMLAVDRSLVTISGPSSGK